LEGELGFSVAGIEVEESAGVLISCVFKQGAGFFFHAEPVMSPLFACSREELGGRQLWQPWDFERFALRLRLLHAEKVAGGAEEQFSVKRHG